MQLHSSSSCEKYPRYGYSSSIFNSNQLLLLRGIITEHGPSVHFICASCMTSWHFQHYHLLNRRSAPLWHHLRSPKPPPQLHTHTQRETPQIPGKNLEHSNVGSSFKTNSWRSMSVTLNKSPRPRMQSSPPGWHYIYSRESRNPHKASIATVTGWG